MPKPAIKNQKTIREAIHEAKKTSQILDATTLRMFALGEEMLEPNNLIELFTAWRKANQRPFMKLFSPTTEGTLRWANTLISNEDRILFVIEQGGKFIGHIGIADFGEGFEVCDVLRGEASTKGTMSIALTCLLQWFSRTGAKQLFLHVATDETPAIALYHRAGFKPTKLIPLKKIETTELICWEKATNSQETFDRFLLRMDRQI